jgi:formylmethanofuran dehydrogenase subunit B
MNHLKFFPIGTSEMILICDKPLNEITKLEFIELREYLNKNTYNLNVFYSNKYGYLEHVGMLDELTSVELKYSDIRKFHSDLAVMTDSELVDCFHEFYSLFYTFLDDIYPPYPKEI